MVTATISNEKVQITIGSSEMVTVPEGETWIVKIHGDSLDLNPDAEDILVPESESVYQKFIFHSGDTLEQTSNDPTVLRGWVV